MNRAFLWDTPEEVKQKGIKKSLVCFRTSDFQFSQVLY